MASLPFQPFKLLSWLFKTLLSQIAWTIVRLELHHLWNPDWTYAMPQMDNQQPPMYGEGGNGGEEGEPGAEGEGDANEYSDYDSEDDDRLIDTLLVKDGGPIPLLQVKHCLKYDSLQLQEGK